MNTTHPLIRALRGLDLPTEDYVIFGSGPLLAHNLRTTIGDLDIVARGRAWQQLASHIPASPAPSGHGCMLRLVIEVTDRWLPGWNTDNLIDTAEFHEGLPFAPLHAVRVSKTTTGRPKDLTDIALIDSIHRIGGPR